MEYKFKKNNELRVSFLYKNLQYKTGLNILFEIYPLKNKEAQLL